MLGSVMATTDEALRIDPDLSRPGRSGSLDLWLEWAGGTGPGIIGALLMASNVSWSGLAYPIWLMSSLSFSAFGLRRGYYGLLLLQTVFTVVNLIGLWRWLVAPALTH